jgi:threonine/homoserine/homoserine lactone efflux protein
MSAAFAEFLLAVVVMELTPGPNMTWLALLAARRGRLAGFQAVAGIAAGLALMGILAGSGAATLILAYPVIYEGLRWGGALFLLYLAFEAWVEEKPSAARLDAGRHFTRGLLINILNPKAAAVFLVMIPAFAGAADLKSLARLSAIYLAIATMVHGAIVIFAGSLQMLTVDPGREVLVRRLFALALGALAIWFAFTTARPVQ